MADYSSNLGLGLSGGEDRSHLRTAGLSDSVTQQTRTQFMDLPAEMRIQIWKYAVPRNRIIRVHLDFRTCLADPVGPFSRVPTILHICRDSRLTALSFLRQGFGNRPPHDRHNNFYWCPEFDRIYLIPSKDWREITSKLLAINRGERESTGLSEWLHLQRVVPEVQHLALPLNRLLLSACDQDSYYQDRFMIRMLQNLPALKNVCFLLQPVDNWLGEFNWESAMYWQYRATPSELQRAAPSTLVLYDPLQVPVRHMSSKWPSSIERSITESFEIYRETEAPDWEPPTVQVVVLGFKRFKSSGFCVSLPSRAESWTADILHLRPWRWSSMSAQGHVFAGGQGPETIASN